MIIVFNTESIVNAYVSKCYFGLQSVPYVVNCDSDKNDACAKFSGKINDEDMVILSCANFKTCSANEFVIQGVSYAMRKIFFIIISKSKLFSQRPVDIQFQNQLYIVF